VPEALLPDMLSGLQSAGPHFPISASVQPDLRLQEALQETGPIGLVIFSFISSSVNLTQFFPPLPLHESRHALRVVSPEQQGETETSRHDSIGSQRSFAKSGSYVRAHAHHSLLSTLLGSFSICWHWLALEAEAGGLLSIPCSSCS